MDADVLRDSLVHDEELHDPRPRLATIEATDLVGDLWSVPAYLRMCTLAQPRGRQGAVARGRPGVDSVRPAVPGRRTAELGDPEASRRRRRQEVAAAAEREQVAAVIDDLIAADDDFEGVVTMLRHPDIRENLVDDDAVPRTDPDLLAGPRAHRRGRGPRADRRRVADAAAPLPSRSLTIVGDRAQARHGFTEPWQERLERVGLDRITLSSLSINYRTPRRSWWRRSRSSGQCSRMPTCRRPSAHRRSRRPRICFDPGIDPRQLARGACRRDRLCHRRFHVPGDVPRPVVDPRAVEGARVRPGRPHRPRGVRRGHRGSGRPLCRDDPGDPAARHPHEHLTSTQSSSGWYWAQPHRWDALGHGPVVRQSANHYRPSRRARKALKLVSDVAGLAARHASLCRARGGRGRVVPSRATARVGARRGSPTGRESP